MTERVEQVEATKLSVGERRDRNRASLNKLMTTDPSPVVYRENWTHFYQRIHDAVAIGVSLALAPQNPQERLAGIASFRREIEQSMSKPRDGSFDPYEIFSAQADKPQTDPKREETLAKRYLAELERAAEITSPEAVAVAAARVYLTTERMVFPTTENVTDRLQVVRILTKYALEHGKDIPWHMPVDVKPSASAKPKSSDALLAEIDDLLNENY